MINTVALSGKLGKDIELRKTTSGKSVVQFQIACFAGRKDSQGVWKSEWINVQAWGTFADTLANVKKGTTITLQGQIACDRWQNSDGSWSNKIFVNVTNLEMPKKQQEQPQQPQYEAPAQAPVDNFEGYNADEFPF